MTELPSDAVLQTSDLSEQAELPPELKATIIPSLEEPQPISFGQGLFPFVFGV